jgi:opacity protein-like surface antigen
MFRKLSLLIAALALVLVVPVAHAAGWTIGVSGGLSKPTGDFGQDSKIGPAAGIDICMHVNDKFAVGVEGNWTQNKHEDVGVVVDLGGGDTYTLNKDNFVNLSGGVHGKFMFPVGESTISPYALLGLGMYKLKEDYEETYVLGGTTTVYTDEDAGGFSENRFGGKVGLGAVYKATEQVGITLQGEINYVTLDEATAGDSSFKFWGIRAGLNFHIMPQ